MSAIEDGDSTYAKVLTVSFSPTSNIDLSFFEASAFGESSCVAIVLLFPYVYLTPRRLGLGEVSKGLHMSFSGDIKESGSVTSSYKLCSLRIGVVEDDAINEHGEVSIFANSASMSEV